MRTESLTVMNDEIGKSTFKALIAHLEEDGTTRLEVSVRTAQELYLPETHRSKPSVAIQVHYSSLNYKDALSASGNRGITKKFPHVPGIDAAGIVLASEDKRFQEGDQVIVTGYDLGSNTSGGFGGRIKVPADWVVPLPDGLTLREAMVIGTAGFTAAYGVKKLLDNGLTPMLQGRQDPPSILVTGASGGVGSMAVGILHRLGFRVLAATGKREAHDFLTSAGADQVHDRSFVTEVDPDRLLLSARWDGAIDTVGGEMLQAVIRQTAQAGVIACCGNVVGHELHTNIYPFILRGVGLMGIDSALCDMSIRQQLWHHLASDWQPKNLDTMIAKEVDLHGLIPEIATILRGGQIGRVLVTHQTESKS